MVADERPDALVGLMHGWLREEERVDEPRSIALP
jgi:hypothetical protein